MFVVPVCSTKLFWTSSSLNKLRGCSRSYLFFFQVSLSLYLLREEYSSTRLTNQNLSGDFVYKLFRMTFLIIVNIRLQPGWRKSSGLQSSARYFRCRRGESKRDPVFFRSQNNFNRLFFLLSFMLPSHQS